MEAYQTRQVLGMVLDRRGSHPEEGTLVHMDLGHQGRREGNHPAGTVLAVESSAALVAGVAGLVARPDATGLAVPVAHTMLARKHTEAEQHVACR